MIEMDNVKKSLNLKISLPVHTKAKMFCFENNIKYNTLFEILIETIFSNKLLQRYVLKKIADYKKNLENGVIGNG